VRSRKSSIRVLWSTLHPATPLVTNRPERFLTEDEARALWERAARLQAEAATRHLPVPADDHEEDVEPEGGLSLDVVRRAAVEAGIDPAFVDDALVELDESGPTRRVDRRAEQYLDDDVSASRIARVIGASVDDTYLALQRVLPRAPYGLTLKRVDGPDPRRGGVLIFEVPYSAAAASGLQMSGPIVDIRHYADFRELRIRMRPLEPGADGEPRTEVEVIASRVHAKRINYWAGATFGGFAAAATGAAGSLLTGGLLALAGPIEAVAMLGVGGLAAIGGWLGTERGWRRAYRWSQRKGERAIEGMLDAVDLDIRTGGAFSTGHQSPAKGDGGDDLLGLSGLLGG